MDFDGIILGTGHNSLILQAYLGKAGLRTLSIDRRQVAGGGLATIENPRRPGFLHNTHSFFHRAITAMPWYRDLGLEARGARYIEPDLNVAVVLRDGRTIEWWRDFDKTIESFRRFSVRDAEKLAQWRERFEPIVEKILVPESQSPPLPPEKRRELLSRSEEGRLLLEVSAWSPLEFVRREFEHPAIQGALLFFNGLREVDLRCPGFGYHIPALLASKGKAQMCVGGSAALARALESAVRETDGSILLQTELKRILIENGRAAGVETADGEVIRARHFVASGLNPQQTFLDLIAPEHLPAAWRERAAAFAYNLIAPLFSLNVALKEPPRYLAADRNAEIGKAFMVILGLDEASAFDEIVRHHEAGTIPPTVAWGATPTLFDPAQAPPGTHCSFLWEKLPYRLHGDPLNWDREKDRHGRRLLDFWTRYAPNLRDAVDDWFVRSALDTERTLPNMKGGDLLIGAFSQGQVGYNRPFTGAGHYRGHVPGLYLCGSSSHPGGNVTGLPGYNCAQVLCSDLDLSADWIPEAVEKRWGAL